MKKPLYQAILLGLSISFTVTTNAYAITEAQLSAKLQQASEDPLSAFSLANAFLHGEKGVPQNTSQASRLLKQVVENPGYDYYLKERSAYLLGYLHLGEKGHPVDKTLALSYFTIASKNIEFTQLADAPFQAALLTENDKSYIKFLTQSAHADHLPAILHLAVAFDEGERTMVNDEAFIFWLTQAANKEHVGAMAWLGESYFFGTKTYKDYDRAYQWLIKAAEQNNDSAQLMVGLIYNLGLGREADTKKARLWFERSANNQNVTAKENLAELLLLSEQKQEQLRGLELLRQAAEKGEKSAATRLAKLYSEGKVVAKDLQESEHWRERADAIADETQGTLIGSKNNASDNEASYTADCESIDLFNQALALFKQKQYQQSLELAEVAARMNLPRAQYLLSLNFYNLAVETQEFDKLADAYAWAKLAANNGEQGAKDLLSDLTEDLNTATVHDGMRKYYDLIEEFKGE